MNQATDPGAIRLQSQFSDFVDELVEYRLGTYKGSLEEYLRSLWSLVEKNKDQLPTWKLFATMMQDALTEPPAPFDSEWMQFTDPSDWDEESKGPEIEYARNQLRYQIADLHRMRDAGVYNASESQLWLGQESPSKHTWHNLFPAIFLSCAVNGSGYAHAEECSWRDLEFFLTVGQNYE